MRIPIEKLKQLEEGNINKKNKDLILECDMLQGNINRMMVTHDEEELLKMFAFAHTRLGNIFWENKIRIQSDKLEKMERDNYENVNG